MTGGVVVGASIARACSVQRSARRRRRQASASPARASRRQRLEQRHARRHRDCPRRSGRGRRERGGVALAAARRASALSCRRRRPATAPRCASARAPAPRRAGRGSASSSPARRSPRCRRRPAAPACSLAATCVAASSRPAANVCSNALSAVYGAWQPVPMRPVAGGGVVHRVVELGRRDQRRRARQRRAHVVADREVAVRRGEDATAARPAIAPAASHARAATSSASATVSGARRRSVGREQRRRRPLAPADSGAALLAANHRARDVPAGQARRPEGDAFDERTSGERCALMRRSPRAEGEHAVAAAEAERIAQRVRASALARCRRRICGPQAGSSVCALSVPGSKPCSSASRLIAASTMPAAPSVWPVQPLVELASVRAGNSSATSARLDLVVLLARRAVQVDVVDVARRRARARQARRRAPARAPRPSGCGVDMWCASLDSP